MKKIALFLLILGIFLMSLTNTAVSSRNRYNICYKEPLELPVGKKIGSYANKPNIGTICETDEKICYLANNVLLYCEKKFL